jgi:transposase
MIGWLNLCNSDKPAINRAQFMRMYAELAMRDERIARMDPEVRSYFEENIQKRLVQDEAHSLDTELKELGVIDG